jgi:hypothetical protein
MDGGPLDERAVRGKPLATVEVVAREEKEAEEERRTGRKRKRKASNEAGFPQEVRHAVLVYVVTQLNEQLFTELIRFFDAIEN